MKSNPFELGIIVGRFQSFHRGHEYIIDKAVEICDTVGIFIGSSQEYGTFKNPFSYETRKRILGKVYGDKVVVHPLPDIGVGNNSAWGEYVLKNTVECFGKAPDMLVSGKEERRLDWFDGIEGISASELYVPKIIDISATEMREFFLNGNVEEWKKYTNKKLWSEFEPLRAEVVASRDNMETSSI